MNLESDLRRRQTTSWRFVIGCCALQVALGAFFNLVVFQGGWLKPVVVASHGILGGTLLVNLVSVTIFLFIFLKLGKLHCSDVWLERRKVFAAVLLAVGLVVVMQAIHLGIAAYRHESITLAWRHGRPATTILGRHLGQLFGNALFEEMFFRGFLVTQCYLLLRTKMSHGRALVWAIVVSQLLFGLIHIPNRIYHHSWTSVSQAVTDLLGLALAGGALAGLWLVTRNLLVCVVMHAFGNYPPSIITCQSPALAHQLLCAFMLGCLLVFVLRRRPNRGLDPKS